MQSYYVYFLFFVYSKSTPTAPYFYYCRCVLLVKLNIDYMPVMLLCFFLLVDPPVITRDPESQSVATGTYTTFRVEATGDKLQFQWQKDDIDINRSEPRFQCNGDGKVSTLLIKDTNKSDKGLYRCLIRNPVEKKGMFSTEANLSVCKSVNLLWTLGSIFHFFFFIFQLIPLR